MKKLIILGDCGVGKTALLNKYTNDVFISGYKATIGVDFFCKQYNMIHDDINYNVTLQLWDTAGQERFDSQNNSFYRGADGVLFVYDIMDQQSLIKIEKYRSQFQQITSTDCPYQYPYLLLGNKIDLLFIKLIIGYFNDYREKRVPIDIMNLCIKYHGLNDCKSDLEYRSIIKGKEYAKKHNMIFHVTSAMYGTNINKAINQLMLSAIQWWQEYGMRLENPYYEAKPISINQNDTNSVGWSICCN